MSLPEKMGVPVQINIEEIRKPDLDAKLVAQNVASAARASCNVPPRDETRSSERYASLVLKGIKIQVEWTFRWS